MANEQDSSPKQNEGEGSSSAEWQSLNNENSAEDWQSLNSPDSNNESSNQASRRMRGLKRGNAILSHVERLQLSEQELFDDALKNMPEGANPAEFIYSEDGYLAFIDQMNIRMKQSYRKADIYNAFYRFSEEYMDHGGRIPMNQTSDKIIFDLNSLRPSDRELIDHAAITRRMQTQRLENITDDVKELIKHTSQDILRVDQQATTTYGNYPTKELFDTLDIFTQISQKEGISLDIAPIHQTIHNSLIPKLLPKNTETGTPNSVQKMNTLIEIARSYPDALANGNSQAIRVANYFVHEEKDPGVKRKITSDMTSYIYSNPSHIALDENSNFTQEFRDYKFYRPSSYQYAYNSETPNSQAEVAATQEIIGTERADMLEAIHAQTNLANDKNVPALIDYMLESGNPQANMDTLKMILGNPQEEPIEAVEAIMVMRKLGDEPTADLDGIIKQARYVRTRFSPFFRAMDRASENGAKGRLEDALTIVDNYPGDEYDPYDYYNERYYFGYFQSRITSDKRLTADEIDTLKENIDHINSIFNGNNISKSQLQRLKCTVIMQGRFLERRTDQEKANFENNVSLMSRLYGDEQYGRYQFGINEILIKRDLFTKSYDTPQSIENLRRIIDDCGDIRDYVLKEQVISFIIDDENFTKKAIANESIRGMSSIIQSIQNSNSLQVHRIAYPLAHQVLQATREEISEDEISYDIEGAKKKLEDIEEVFLQNNIPNLGKNLLVFSMLHPMESFREDFIDGHESSVSPSLELYSRDRPYDAYTLILRDLIHNGVNSNSRELRNYIENLQNGQAIMDSIAQGDTTYGDLSVANQAVVRDFVNSLAVGHNQTREGREEIRQQNGSVMSEADIPEGANWLYRDMPITPDTIKRINRAMGANEHFSAADKLIRQFGYLGGFTSVKRALEIMDNARSSNDARNRAAAEQPPIIHPGDLIKNVSGKYLDDMLSDGTNCKEYLGSNADSDATPLDADFTMHLGGDTSIAECDEIQKNPNGNYGYVWYITHNTPDRFVTTRKSTGHPGGIAEKQSFLDNRRELFQTGAMGDSHYGVRTGISSGEIDAIIIDTDHERSDRTAFRIVKNGFYIPVYDKTGKLIFTPENYDKLRSRLSGNHEYRTGEYHRASAEDFSSDAIYTTGIDVDIEANAAEVKRKDDAIRAALEKKLRGTNLRFRDHIDNDLTPGFIEISNTGSTGRGTNVPGDGDFDYIFRIDRSIIANPSLFHNLSNQLLGAIILDQNSEHRSGIRPQDIRTKHAHVAGLDDEVDIDITFIPRTDKVTYATEDAIKDFLSNFEGEERTQVIKNIIAAKKLFKAHECYKPRHAGGEDENGKPLAQGGLGGVGVENWILQSGGSLTAAARSFLEAANVYGRPDAEPIPLTDFTENYPIWDLGANHMAEEKDNYPHDNFVANNLNEEGYIKIIETLREFLGENRN